MTESQNPYQSPNAIEFVPRWWLKLRKMFEPSPLKLFLRGRAIICEGIAFSLDPKSRRVFYAASPSINHSDERMDLIVEEALRILPVFVNEYPELRAGVLSCNLCVQMIHGYNDVSIPCIREVKIDREAFEAAMSGHFEQHEVNRD
jgi:hypothetical protein